MTAQKLQQQPLLFLEDKHFDYVEELQQRGYLTEEQRRRLWRIERELNRRALAPRVS